MPGVNYTLSERRYSASNWYTDIDTALMGIQSTAQFVDKYHHVIGKTSFSLTKFMFGQVEREGSRGFILIRWKESRDSP